MSSNLDHVLYGKLNSSDEDKENDAYAFAKNYKDDIDGFLKFISDSDFSRMEGYKESWAFIKKDVIRWRGILIWGYALQIYVSNADKMQN